MAEARTGRGGGRGPKEDSRFKEYRGDFAELFFEYLGRLGGSTVGALLTPDFKREALTKILPMLGGSRDGNITQGQIRFLGTIPKILFKDNISEEAGQAFVEALAESLGDTGMSPSPEHAQRIIDLRTRFDAAFKKVSGKAADEDLKRREEELKKKMRAESALVQAPYLEIMGRYTDDADMLALVDIVPNLESDAAIKEKLSKVPITQDELKPALVLLKAGKRPEGIAWVKRVLGSKEIPKDPPKPKSAVTKFFDDTKAGFAGVRDEANKVLGEMSRKPYEVTIAQHMTLQEFANQQGVNIPVAYLRVVNKLDSDHLVPGQVIKVVTEVPALFKKMAERMEGRR